MTGPRKKYVKPVLMPWASKIIAGYIEPLHGGNPVYYYGLCDYRADIEGNWVAQIMGESTFSAFGYYWVRLLKTKYYRGSDTSQYATIEEAKAFADKVLGRRYRLVTDKVLVFE